MECSYKFKFYINARHSVNFDGNQSDIHPHTWETVIYIGVKSQSYINFTKMEKVLETYFHQYEGRYLNDLKCFKESQSLRWRI